MGAAGSSPLVRLRLRLPALLRPGLGLAALGLAAAALGAVAWSRARSRRRRRQRRRLQQVGTVSQLWIYPVKSCKGVPVSEAECTALGLRRGHLRDRFWLVINKEGNMVTARQEPRLVLISPTCEGDTLTLSAAYTEDLQLPIKTPTTNAVHNCSVLGLSLQRRRCGLDLAWLWLWLFSKTCPERLQCTHPHQTRRPNHQLEHLYSLNDRTAFCDVEHFFIFSELVKGILTFRTCRLLKEVHFHPRLTSSGLKPSCEDSWDELLIGDVELKRVMACYSYRLCDPSEEKLYGKSPFFGQYFVLENPGTIQVGDPVYLLGQESEPYDLEEPKPLKDMTSQMPTLEAQCFETDTSALS
uniref:Molybdenum cofactor sulfurase middle domain-containing protein n=1 Tax=Sus scrofa TaxID=9823 RepID=A0A8D1NEG4_PIG